MKKEVKPLGYARATTRGGDVDAYPIAELRQRVGDERLKPTFRYDFHVFLFVTSGECEHWIDFRPVKASVGTCLSIRPAQAHRFHFDQRWDGWLVVFRPEAIVSARGGKQSADMSPLLSVDRDETPLSFDANELALLIAIVERMHLDVLADTSSADKKALLWHQLQCLILRMGMLCARQLPQFEDKASLARFRKFRMLLETSFSMSRNVGFFAKRLGCSEKSLNRAVADATGTSAKAFIASRVILEAKRLLTQSDETISVIGGSLGFSETTSFVKFFRNETGMTPGGFRRGFL